MPINPASVLSLVIPIAAGLLQWSLWAALSPLTWILLYPAVFLSAYLGGLLSGLIATAIAVLIGIYFFIPFEGSFNLADVRYYYSTVIFALMGLSFNLAFEQLRRSKAELQRIASLESDVNHRRLNQALRAANAGIWEWNLQTNENQWDEGLWRLFGLEPFFCQACYDLWLSTVHPDDRAMAQVAIHQAVQQNIELNVEWRLAELVDGRERWLMSCGQPEFDEQGRPMLYRGIVVDISARKHSEKQLQDEQRRLSFALDTLQAGAWELNLETHAAHRTLLHDQIFGYGSLLPEWTYEMALEHFLPEDRQAVDNCFQAAIATQSDWSFEARIRRANDGEIRWILAKGRHQRDQPGSSISLSGIVQDITERKLTENALQTSEKQFRVLAESMPQIVWITRADGWNVYFNRQWVEYTGLSLAQSVGQGWSIPLHPDDKQQALQVWRNAVDELAMYSLECRLRRADGIYRWWLIRGVPVFADNGRIDKWFGTCTDIHDLKQAELDLRTSEARWQFALEGSNQGVWDWNIAENKVFFSHCWKSMLGYADEDVGESLHEWSDRVHPDDLPGALEAIQRHFRQETPHYQYEHRLRDRRGEYRWTLARGVVLSRDADGQPVRMIGTQSDISESRKIEQNLREKERLLADSQAVAHIGSWVRYLPGGQAMWSEETFRLFGLSPETDQALSMEQLLDRVHPDDREARRAWHQDCLAGNCGNGLEYRIFTAQGQQRWVLSKAKLETTDDG